MELKMKYYFLSIIIIAFIFGGCSKLQDNITPPPVLSIHQSGNNDTSSVEFHGNMLKANNFDLSSCKQCHAADFSGGITKVACSSCHNYPHVTGFVDTTSAAFHGLFLKANNFNLTECQKCHGADFTGNGTAQLNCKSCHSLYPHDPGFAVTTSPAFHGLYLRANNYNMDKCQTCHGSDFAGNGAAQASCKSCHTQTAGPLACNTCHGTFSDPTRTAPPRDPSGNTATNIITVGAHVSHLYENDFAVVACENCHKVPNANNVKDHYTSVPHTIVVLDSLATHGQASNAVFSTSSGTCANTYCHGNFQFNKADAPSERQFAYTADQMIGNNKTVNWTNLDGTQAPCGSCHGTPDGYISPVGHIKVSIHQCVACHSTVVDINGNIIDKTKHINGQINYALTK
jgi:predicted CxxxxCH...CXXCH cytochrome family protein